jgi:hypothetical protein
MGLSVEVQEADARRADEARPQAQIWAEPRHLFFFRLGTLLGESGQTPIEILALAESGAVVRTGETLQEGSALMLEVNSHHRFPVRVEWSSEALAGLEFVDREHVRATLAGRDRAHPYRAPRLVLEADIVLSLGEACLTARARDLSEGGIKVELAEPGHVGRKASVIVPGVPPLTGRILWWRDGRAGISFDRPLPFRGLVDCLNPQPAHLPEA